MSLGVFTKAKHFNERFVNGEGRTVPVRFTILSKLSPDGTEVDYAVSWCATTEMTFRKKDGVAEALQKEVYRAPLLDVPKPHDHWAITDAIIEDILNHADERNNVPFAHHRWLKWYKKLCDFEVA